MVRRNGLVVGLMVLLSQAAGSQTVKYSHPGTVIDAVSREGIEAATTAYGSQNRVGNESCPTYAETLDSQRSQPKTGVFNFHIDKSKSSYLATYCEAGYAPTTVPTNDNLKNNSRVQPDPIELYPSQSALSARKVDRVDAAYQAVGYNLDRVHANLTYFARADEEGFYKAIARFSPDDQQAIKLLLRRKSVMMPANSTSDPRR